MIKQITLTYSFQTLTAIAATLNTFILCFLSSSLLSSWHLSSHALFPTVSGLKQKDFTHLMIDHIFVFCLYILYSITALVF